MQKRLVSAEYQSNGVLQKAIPFDINSNLSMAELLYAL